LREQAGKLLHTSFHVCAYPGYFDVCRKLIDSVRLKGPGKAALFNSGSEAVENAVKFARAFTKRRGVISFQHGFHGRTLLCLTLDGKHRPLRTGIGPFATDVFHAPIPNPYRPPEGVAPEKLADYALARLEEMFLTDVAPEDVAAIIIEP